MDNIKVSFYECGQIADALLTFAVIATKQTDGKWIFCRHIKRDTLEIPGGHRESGEAIENTARRELWEETGALEYDLYTVCVYAVNKSDTVSYGMLYHAEVKKFGDIPSESEIAEILRLEIMPINLTYPLIQPFLFEKIQIWLSLQSAKDELWDVYDKDRKLTGRTHKRGDPLADGDHHLVVHVWIQNSKGEFLITKRAPNKGYPNIWESTGGSALAGDDSLTAAMREVKEETGLDVKPENGKCIFSSRRKDNFCDVWLFRQNFNLKDVILQPGETIDCKYSSKDEIRQMLKNGEFYNFTYLEDLFKLV